MTSPAASLRGGAVGALTVALAVAAHGMAGGGYPSGSATVFLLVVGIGVGAIATVPSPASQLPAVFGGLMLGQMASHVALSVGSPHEIAHAHSVLPSPAMLGFHLAASAAAAVLVCVAERLYGPITSIFRAVLHPLLPLPDAPALLAAGGDVRIISAYFPETSISRRGPPVSV